ERKNAKAARRRAAFVVSRGAAPIAAAVTMPVAFRIRSVARGSSMTVRVPRSPRPRLRASVLASALLLGSLCATPLLAQARPAQASALQAEAERLAAQL